MIDMDYLAKVEEYIDSGRLAEDFEYSAEERRYELLDFMEKLMEIGEKAEEVATKVIFKGSYLETLAGVKTQK